MRTSSGIFAVNLQVILIPLSGSWKVFSTHLMKDDSCDMDVIKGTKQEELSQSRLEFPCSIRSISTVAPPALTGCAIRRNDGIPVGISLQSNDIIVHDEFLCHMPLSARRKIFRDLPLCPLEIINNASHLQANRVSPSFVIRPMIFHFRFLRNIHVHLVHSLHFFEFTFERSATIYVI